MNAIKALACLVILAGPARAADMVERPLPAPSARGVAAPVAGPAAIPALSVPSGLSLPGAALPGAAVPSAALPGAPSGAASSAPAPIAAAPDAAPAGLPRAEASDVLPAAKAASPLSGAAKSAGPAQAAEATPRVSALGQASGIAAAAGEAGGARVTQASDRVFDNLGAARSSKLSVPGSESAGTPRLAPSTPEKAAAQAPETSPYAAFAGTWHKTSGTGYMDQIRVSASKDSVQLRWGPSFEYGTGGFSDIGAGPVADEPWRGNSDAPGGLVTRVTEATFSGNVLTQRSVRTETHLVRIPNRLVETHTLELRDGRLIETTEAVLYRKAFFYFGPYNVRTRINTTNLADPASPKRTTVYERASDAPRGSALVGGGAQAVGTGSRSTGGVVKAMAAVAATLGMTSPALAAAASGASSGHLGATALGAVIGFVGAALIGWARRDRTHGGDIDFTPLFNLVKTLLYGLGGGALGAIVATAIHHSAGGGIAIHPGLATAKALAGAATGFAAGAGVGWLRRDKSTGGDDFGFGFFINLVKAALYGLAGAVVGAVLSSLI